MEDKNDLSFIDSYQWNQPNDTVKEIIGSLLKMKKTAADTTTVATKNACSKEALQIYLSTAKNPRTPAAILDALTKLGCDSLAMHVAENPNTEGRTLNDLAFHEQPDVRAAVAENNNTPIETMWLLANDEHPDIRFSLAENHNNPLTLLLLLAEDENPYVSHRAQRTIRRIQSANVSPSILSPNSRAQRRWSSAY